MGDDDLLDLPRLLDQHRDRAPVGEQRHRELGETLERPLELERRGEQRSRLAEEGEPLAQRLLGRREPGSLEGERRLPSERDLERAVRAREPLIGREGEDEPTDRAALAHERKAHESVTRL